MNGVAVIIEKFRSDKDEVRNRVGEATGREPERVVLSLDDYLRLVADTVQASVLRDRARWLDSLIAIVKGGECGVDPFDQSKVPESSADAAVKLLCIFARMNCDDIFAEAEEPFPQPNWDGKELVFDAKREFLHELYVRCRGIWVETKHPTSKREAFDGGVGQKPVEPMALVPAELEGGLSFSVLESELERWLELGFGRVFGESVETRTDDSNQYPPTTKEDREILLYLLTNHPETCIQPDVSSGTGIERKLAQARMKYLRENRLTHRPNGERKGDGLTDLGMTLARTFQQRESETEKPGR